LNKKWLLFLFLLILGGASMWYINYPAHEKRAEDRIHKYMDAQGINKHNVFEKHSSKDTKINTSKKNRRNNNKKEQKFERSVKIIFDDKHIYSDAFKKKYAQYFKHEKIEVIQRPAQIKIFSTDINNNIEISSFDLESKSDNNELNSCSNVQRLIRFYEELAKNVNK